MSRTVRSRAETRAATRAAAVLALLLGLLAMHGLASAHHAAAAPPVVAGGTTTEVSHAAQGHPATSGRVGDPLLAATAVDLPGSEHCQECAEAAVLLCLAVLSAVVLLVLGLVRRHRRHAAALRQTPRAQRLGPPAPRRPPDLVAELCVSRT